MNETSRSKKTNAGRRWDLLKGYLLASRRSGLHPRGDAVSIRRALPFDFCLKEMDPERGAIRYTEFSLTLQLHGDLPSVEEMRQAAASRSDTTGLIELWPAEEALALWIDHHVRHSAVAPASMLELGAGYGLAGLVGGLLLPRVVLTDGNPTVVGILAQNIAANGLQQTTSARVLNWRDSDGDCNGSVLSETFDLVVCSDCFYFEEVHADLLRVMVRALSAGGSFVGVAPSRSGKLEAFAALANKSGAVEAKILDEVLPVVSQKIAAAKMRLPAAFESNLHDLRLIVIRSRSLG